MMHEQRAWFLLSFVLSCCAKVFCATTPRHPKQTHIHTGPPPANLTFDGTQLEQLVTVTGAGSARGETGDHATDIR
jgi:hypothetical protein